ncbi:MAG: cadherin-like domain-containing protein [Clostridia bacterium]|nr:cadherin-like domain-containing protein [Clostridia bacterium]
MKRLTVLAVLTALLFTLTACSGNGTEQTESGLPPAFSVIQKQLKLNKHCERGESAAFSKEEFESLLGEKLTYITVTSIPEGAGTLVYNGKAVIKDQSIPAAMLGYLKFVPAAGCTGASFGFTCDSASFKEKEIECDIVFAESVNSPPVAKNSGISTVEGISCNASLAITEPNGDDFTVNVITYPADGFISVNADGSIVYSPNEGFFGTDKMVYTVTDRFGAVSERATLSIEVKENESGIYFADMQEDLNHIHAHRMCENNTMIYRKENGSYYFEPQKKVSRMEFLVMLMSVSGHDNGITAVADSVASDDGGLSSGLKGYIAAAADKGLIALDNGKFLPEAEITLGEAVLMASNALSLPVAENSSEPMHSAVAAAVAAGLIETDNGAVDISAVLTKAETAVLLCKIDDYMTENNIKSGK